ncbi:MAG: MmgE/PrpD family protein, partial [bacterium]
MSRLEEFSSWAVNLGYGEIPDDVLKKTRLQVMNMLAAMIAGYRTEQDTRQSGDGGPCRTFSGPNDAPGAFFDYALNAMRHDFDDYLLAAHSGHSSVLAPLAVGQAVNASGQDFLKAVAVANELEGRLGASTVLGPHNGQMWSFIHASGAAAATALLKNANSEEFLHAVLLSLYSPNYPNPAGFMGGDSKNL